jgi:hypothetical protein
MDKLFYFVLYLCYSITSTANENKGLSKWWQILRTEPIFIYSGGNLSICKLFHQWGSVVCIQINTTHLFLLHSCCLFWWYNNLNIDNWLYTISFSFFALASFAHIFFSLFESPSMTADWVRSVFFDKIFQVQNIFFHYKNIEL